MKKIIAAAFMLLTAGFSFSQSLCDGSFSYPKSYTPQMEAMLNCGNESPENLKTLYDSTMKEISETKQGDEKTVMELRAIYTYARSLRYTGRIREAEDLFDSAVRQCDNVLKSRKLPDARLIKAECICQNMITKPRAYSALRGPQVKSDMADLLKSHPENCTVIYILATMHLFPPPPFDDMKKGMEELEKAESLCAGSVYDRFSIKTAKARTLLKNGQPDEARKVLETVLSEHPDNSYALQLWDEVNNGR